MSETDPGGLHEQLEGEADKLQKQSDRLGGEVQDTRQDWEQKRSDPGVPGAVPPPDEDQGDEGQHESPAPEAEPPEEGSSAAETAPEGATGPPKDQSEDDDEDD